MQGRGVNPVDPVSLVTVAPQKNGPVQGPFFYRNAHLAFDHVAYHLQPLTLSPQVYKLRYLALATAYTHQTQQSQGEQRNRFRLRHIGRTRRLTQQTTLNNRVAAAANDIAST